MKFKVGDKVKLYNIDGDGYGLPIAAIDRMKELPYATIMRVDYSIIPRVWFYEVGGYWNPKWFKKINTQLEFDFNV